MLEIYVISFVLFILAILQSIVGVGILVIGTPFLLILNYNIVEILSILLPVSILTSLINLIFFKINKKKLQMKINSSTKYLFFFVCLPSIFIGFYFLENFKEMINFKYLVSIIIIFSLILIKLRKNFFKINNQLRMIYLFLIGVIHGLSNSGGTLLSLFMSSHLKKNNSRYGITFFYFFLALFQFIIFNYFFNIDTDYSEFKYLFLTLPLSIFLGNYLIKFMNEEKFKKIVEIIIIITCFFLITS